MNPAGETQVPLGTTGTTSSGQPIFASGGPAAISLAKEAERKTGDTDAVVAQLVASESMASGDRGKEKKEKEEVNWRPSEGVEEKMSGNVEGVGVPSLEWVRRCCNSAIRLHDCKYFICSMIRLDSCNPIANASTSCRNAERAGPPIFFPPETHKPPSEPTKQLEKEMESSVLFERLQKNSSV